MRDSFGRKVLELSLVSLKERPSVRLTPSRFVALVVSDFPSHDRTEAQQFFSHLLQQGAVYVNAWGPDSASLELAADLAIISAGPVSDSGPAVLTTSLGSEPLSEAIWFTFDVAFPDPPLDEGCDSTVVISVGLTSDRQSELTSLVRAAAAGEGTT